MCSFLNCVFYFNDIFLQKTTSLVVDTSSVATEINIWIIVGAVLGAVILLAIVSVVLWKVSILITILQLSLSHDISYVQ